MSEDMDDQETFVEMQRVRYNDEADEHFIHNQDRWTQNYREKFVRKYLSDIDFSGKLVLDAMCASGIETGYLINRDARVVGLDISENNAHFYNKKWDMECKVGSIHKSGFPNNHFDMVYIYGGLHHVLPILSETLKEIHRILKPGGVFIFVEPNKDTWLNVIRKFWYKHSSRFQDEEDAISYARELRPYLDFGFKEQAVHYGGNIAYLLISQSSILGIGQSAKKAMEHFLFAIERAVTNLPLVPKLFFLATWKKL